MDVHLLAQNLQDNSYLQWISPMLQMHHLPSNSFRTPLRSLTCIHYSKFFDHQYSYHSYWWIQFLIIYSITRISIDYITDTYSLMLHKRPVTLQNTFKLAMKLLVVYSALTDEWKLDKHYHILHTNYKESKYIIVEYSIVPNKASGDK